MFRNSWKYYSPPYVGICCYLSLHLYHGRRSDLFSAQNKTKSNAYIQVGMFHCMLYGIYHLLFSMLFTTTQWKKKTTISDLNEWLNGTIRLLVIEIRPTTNLIRLHVCVCVWCLLYTLVRRPWPSFTIRGLFTSAPFVGVFNHAPIITAKHW